MSPVPKDVARKAQGDHVEHAREAVRPNAFAFVRRCQRTPGARARQIGSASRMPNEMQVLRTAEDLTAAWLEESLGTGSIVGFRAEEVGTGQMSRNHRVTID